MVCLNRETFSSSPPHCFFTFFSSQRRGNWIRMDGAPLLPSLSSLLLPLSAASSIQWGDHWLGTALGNHAFLQGLEMRCENEKKGGWLIRLAVRDDDDEQEEGDRGKEKETVQGFRRRG